MARWLSHEPVRQISPAWYRVFDLAAWDEPDGEELVMMGGNSMRPWPDAEESAWPDWPQFLHVIHAKRRWAAAKYAYLRQHPEFAEQELEEINAARAVRRSLLPGGSSAPIG